jgi:hypothetical protein
MKGSMAAPSSIDSNEAKSDDDGRNASSAESNDDGRYGKSVVVVGEGNMIVDKGTWIICNGSSGSPCAPPFSFMVFMVPLLFLFSRGHFF